MSARIVARGLSFELPDGRELFTDLDLSLGNGLTALTGPNGVGKSCLARVLAGELAPTAGVIQRHARVSLLPQRQEPQAQTVAHFLGSGHSWSPAAEALLQGINPASACLSLSGGQWTRVRLAQVLGSPFLILDEPSNDLDREGRDALAGFLRQHRSGALIISHDPELLSLCQDILELSSQGLSSFHGDWSAYSTTKDQERERLSRALEVAKRERDAAQERRAQQAVRQEKRGARGSAAAARGGLPGILAGARKRSSQVTRGRLGAQALERSQDAVRAAHEALSALKVEPVMYARLRGRTVPAGKRVAEAHSFNVCLRDWIYSQNLDFSWRGSVRVTLQGGNGAGKTTLVKALLGERFNTRGELRRGELASLYIDQRCSGLDDNSPLLDNVLQAANGSAGEIRTGLAAFLFTEDKVFQKVRDLSGGERLRAALACGFLGAQLPELLVLDEPTNNLDLLNVAFLHELVSGFQGALVVISHDAEFLRSCNVTGELRVGPL